MLLIYFYGGIVAEWYTLADMGNGEFAAFPRTSRESAIEMARLHRENGKHNAKAVSVKMLARTAKGMTTYGQFLR